MVKYSSKILRQLLFSLVVVSFWPQAAMAEEAKSEQETLKAQAQSIQKVAAYRLIGDFEGAVHFVQKALDEDPTSLVLQEALVLSLAEQGAEALARKAYQKYCSSWNHATQLEVLETIAWSIMRQAGSCEAVFARLASLIGSVQTHDMYAVEILLNALRSPRAPLRAIACELCALMRDDPLKDELLRLLVEESNWQVRLAVIGSLGKMHVQRAMPFIATIVESERVCAEEKWAAIRAIVEMIDQVDPSYLHLLATHERFGMRQLACELIAKLELKDQAELLVTLFQDCRSEVRQTALNALGLLRIEGEALVDKVRPLLKDRDREVAITASWLMALLTPQEGVEALTDWLTEGGKQERRLAAAAIGHLGKYGLPVAEKFFQSHPDSYVRANLSLGLLGQRMHVEQARKILCSVFETEKGRWMWDESRPLFRVLVPSTVRHDSLTPNRPELVNQLTRLEVLSILAIAEHPRAQELIKSFLKERSWGVTGNASSFLLEEGDSAALDLIRALLDDPDHNIKVQAALALAIWGKDPAALKVLEEAYWQAGRELKLNILEAMGHISARESLPFLIKVLDDPFQTFRVLAASSIVQCINN